MLKVIALYIFRWVNSMACEFNRSLSKNNKELYALLYRHFHTVSREQKRHTFLLYILYAISD